MDKVKVGIIGVGNMGGTHARTIADGKVDGMTLAALCDIDANRSTELRSIFNVPVYLDYQEMIAKEQLDAVIIATPHYFHCPIAEDCLANGLNVLVEKPMGVRASDAKKLAAGAEKQDKTFAIMFNQRTNELFTKAKELVSEGKLGKIKRSVWIITNWYRTQAYYDSGSWRATWRGEGGGVLMNQAPHNLDLWQWILGMPSKVTAFCPIAKYHHIEVEDEATIFAEFPGGATGIFATSTGEFPGTNRLEISGSLGKLVLEEGKLKLWELEEDEEKFRFESKRGFASIPYKYSETVQEKPEEGHLNILKNFTGAILRGEKLISPGTDGVNEITLANAAYLSAWTGSPVELPLDCKSFDNELEKRISSSKTHEQIKEEFKINSSYSERWQVRW